VTQQSARYVAGYVTKKISGEPKDDWYMGRVPEYGRGSNGIGLIIWLSLDLSDEHWIIVIDGSKYRIPRYYDEKYKALDGLHLTW